MVFNIIVFTTMVLLAGVVVFDIIKQNKFIDMITKLALKVAELEDTIHHIDESTGVELHQLRDELRRYQQLYGEAAVEAERETARAQKAWADGINGIMSYGANFQNRSDS